MKGAIFICKAAGHVVMWMLVDGSESTRAAEVRFFRTKHQLTNNLLVAQNLKVARPGT